MERIRGKLTVGLVIDNENILQQVNEAISKNFPQNNGSSVAVLGQWTDLGLGFDMLRDCRPDIAIIGLCSREKTDVYSLAERVTLSLPNTQLFIISEEKDPEIMLKTMRVGAREYLTTPLDDAELLNAIHRIKAALEVKMGTVSPRLIGVVSAKGGVGCTTVAVNLAVALRLATNKRVLLMEGCVGGDVTLFLNLKYRHTLKDVIENLDRLDSTLLTSYTVEHSSGVRIIPAMELGDYMFNSIPAMNKEATQFLVHLLSKDYDYIIADLGTDISKNALEILRMLDTILLVFPLELSALRSVRQKLAVFEQLDLHQNTKLVVNRYDKLLAKGATAISLEDVVKTVNKPIFCTIPDDYGLVSEAINLGLAVVMEKRKSHVAQSFLKLVDLVSRPKPQASKEAIAKG